MTERSSNLKCKWLLGIIGVVAGLVWGVAAMAFVYVKGPGTHSAYELIVQVILVIFTGLVVGAQGFLIGWGIELLAGKKSA